MIKDLLWACVVCGARESLRPSEAGKKNTSEVCLQCGTRYQRGRGANIIVTRQGREPVEKHAREWTALLPPIEPTGSARCTLRVADEDRPIRAFGMYWGRYEHFGEPAEGTLTLTDQRLSFEPADRAHRLRFDWSLLDLTAIQLSSSTLQLKAKRHPVVTIRFATSSSRLWEERLQMAVRSAYRRAGLGDVVEFQPRIVT